MTKKRILLIDDEPGFTRILKLYLEKTGAYEVREENKASMALATAKRFKPDLILLDVIMPDMDGGEVASNIIADDNLKKIPIVFLTAVLAKNEQTTISGYPFIAKPVTADQVLECLQVYLGPVTEPITLSNSTEVRDTGFPPSGRTGQDQERKKVFHGRPHLSSLNYFLVTLLASFLVGSGIFGYKLYTQSKQSQRETLEALQRTRKELLKLRSSTSAALSIQRKQIDENREQLGDKNDSFLQMESMAPLLEKTLKDLEETESLNSRNNSRVSSSLLSELAPSVVKLYCLVNSNSDYVQRGSGLLLRAAPNNPKFPLYYVQTNLHVAEPMDHSTSQCKIVLYPDTTDSNSYLVFKSKSYRYYGKEIDVAFLEPEYVKNNPHSGSRNDLDVHARDEEATPLCNSINMGDRLSILGYPGIGG